MRKLFERISQRLQAFIAQRDHAALLVRCSDADSVSVLKLLEALDDTSSSELFWMHFGDFLNDRTYVDGLVTEFLTKHNGMREVMRQKQMKVWPPAPANLADDTIAPAERLRELMTFSRSLLPEREGCSAVWVMFPLHIIDVEAYSRLMLEVLEHKYPFPWFHHIRIILRDDLSNPIFSQRTSRMRAVDEFTPDLSEQAMDQALEEEAADQSVPLPDRLQSMFLSAQRDFAFGRHDESLKKLEIFLRYHTAMGNAPMVALALNTVGEIHQKLGRVEQAGRCFEAAVEPACAGENPPLPVLLNVVLNLANLRMAQARFPEAEAYYDAAEKLATIQRNPSAKLQTIENLGYCQYMRGNAAEAAKNWQTGASVASKLGESESEKRLLLRLRDHYINVKQPALLQEVEARIATIAAPQN